MAKILLKRGKKTNLDNLTLLEGEVAIAYNDDKSQAELYAGNGTDKICLNKDVSGIVESLGEKVDKVSGKGLSTEDFTTEEKTKLAGLSNYQHPEKHPASIITPDSMHRFTNDAEKSAWNNKLSPSSTIDGGTF